jgi:hypothetical protein
MTLCQLLNYATRYLTYLLSFFKKGIRTPTYTYLLSICSKHVYIVLY